ncbi:MAG: hypothetical protein U1F56_09465 [Rubrivivax sp.]
MVRDILPNSLGPVIVAGTIDVGGRHHRREHAVVPGPGLPTPDMMTWGRILYDARDFMDIATVGALPGAAIFVTVLAVNLIGDGLRDAPDPRRDEPPAWTT